MKQLNQKLTASEDFLEALSEPNSSFRDLGEHHLKGKNQAVRLFGLT